MIKEAKMKVHISHRSSLLSIFLFLSVIIASTAVSSTKYGSTRHWSKNHIEKSGRENDRERRLIYQTYQFDGSTNAIVIPETKFNHNLTDKFTVSFWMKHESSTSLSDSNKHIKEHVLCNSDDHKKNRHHYSLFIRNCRLVLLLRREFQEESRPTKFRPAEWRWKLKETCDNDWHRYQVSVDFPEVTLYIDGARFEETNNNPDIVDDWPLHSVKGVNTTFVVGACWEGRDSKMNFHFKGLLAGLSILRGETGSAQFLLPEQPSITLNGTANLAREYESFVQGIELFSTVSLAISDQAEVISDSPDDTDTDEYNSWDSDEDEDDSSSDEDEKTNRKNKMNQAKKIDSCTVQVYPPLNPDYEYFRLPVNYMSHLGIHYKETKDGLVIHGSGSIHSYQTALRQVVYFNRQPAFYLNRAFKLSCSELSGRFNSNDYMQTLTVIHPKTTSPPPTTPSTTSTTTDRIGELLKKSPSNLNDISMNDIDSHLLNEPFPARAQLHDHRVEMKDSRTKSSPISGGFLDSGLMDAGDAFARTSVNTGNSHLSPIVVGHAVTVIIVVCVGFLVFMIVLGVIRIRAAHHRGAGSGNRGSSGNPEEDQELVWDDTALTITVNPLDQLDSGNGACDSETGLGGSSHHHHHPNHHHSNHHQDQDCDDESDTSSNESYHEDDQDSSDDDIEEGAVGGVTITNGKNKDNLVWDDSALGF